jgi:hypothetical protein
MHAILLLSIFQGRKYKLAAALRPGVTVEEEGANGGFSVLANS